MIPYILLYFILVCLLLASTDFSDAKLYLLSVFILALFSGVRYNVGVDYSSYLSSFNRIHYNIDSRFEFFTIIISKVVFYIGGNAQLIFIAYSLIAICGVSFFISKFTDRKELSLFIFFTISIFYLATLNGIRQWAAIAMFYVSLVFLNERKFYFAWLFLIFAVLFHSSAAILLLIAPLLRNRYKLKYIVGFMMVCTLLGKVLLALLNFTPFYVYIELLHFENNSSNFLISLYVVILMYFMIKYKYFSKNEQMDQKLIILLNLNLFSILTLYIGSIVLGLDFLSVNRVNMYFELQLLILVPYLLNLLESRLEQQLATYTVVLICSLFFFYTIIVNGDKYKLTPYDFNLSLW